MNKYFTNSFLLALAGITVIFNISCNKDYNSAGTGSFGAYSSIDTIYNMLMVPSKFVTVNGATGASFYGNSGTRYVIPGGCLQDASGKAVTGDVQVEVAEYLKKGDMLFSKMLPVSDGEPLLSGGEIYINANYGGQRVYLKPGCSCMANIPKDKDSSSGMQFFAGQPITNSIDNNVNWKRQPDSLRFVSVVYYYGDTITIISDSFRFCNADKFMDTPKYQSFSITVSIAGSNITDLSTIRCFALYDNYKGEWPIYSSNRGIIEAGHVPNIPVHLVVFGVIGNKFYGGTLGVIPATGSSYVVNLTEVDPFAFKRELNNLTN